VRIDNLLKVIDDLKESLLQNPPLNAGELKRLREQFMVQNTYNSNAIEGNTLTLNETALVVLEGLTINKKPLKDHMEAIGHKDAFEYMIRISGDKEPLTERVIKDIHSLVLVADTDNKGKYREYPVVISGAQDTPPDPVDIPTLMRELLEKYVSDTRHPIEKIADFHIQFERIHPFIDGNGRTGRLVLNLELIKAGYAPVDIKYKDREDYINCFKDYEVSRHSGAFIKMVAEYEIEELKGLVVASEKKKEAIEQERHTSKPEQIEMMDKEKLKKMFPSEAISMFYGFAADGKSFEEADAFYKAWQEAHAERKAEDRAKGITIIYE
jgi:Fic family protein